MTFPICLFAQRIRKPARSAAHGCAVDVVVEHSRIIVRATGNERALPELAHEGSLRRPSPFFDDSMFHLIGIRYIAYAHAVSSNLHSEDSR